VKTDPSSPTAEVVLTLSHLRSGAESVLYPPSPGSTASGGLGSPVPGGAVTNGLQVAWSDTDGRVVVLDVAAGTLRRVETWAREFGELRFDGRYLLATFESRANGFSQIGIADATADPISFNVATSPVGNSEAPVLLRGPSSSVSTVAFLSDRDVVSEVSSRELPPRASEREGELAAAAQPFFWASESGQE
jgi:hypothetical protein